MRDYGTCGETLKSKSIKVKENKMSFTVLNPKQVKVIKVRVDDCLIKKTKRCDYLFDIDSKNVIHYVELKGRDVEKAAKQLRSTLIFCKTQHSKQEKVCHIVSSRVPLQGPKVQILKLKFLRETKSRLEIKCRQASISI